MSIVFEGIGIIALFVCVWIHGYTVGHKEGLQTGRNTSAAAKKDEKTK